MKVIIAISIIILAFMIPGCTPSGGNKTLNERISLRHKDKIPYGTYVAYNNLKYIFPDADISVNMDRLSLFGDYTESDTLALIDTLVTTDKREKKKERTAFISVVNYVNIDSSDVLTLINKAAAGNYVFISSFSMGKALLDNLHLGQSASHIEDSGRGRNSWIVFDPVSSDSVSYAYPGSMSSAYFSKLDSGFTTVLGTNGRGMANFIRINYDNGGSIFLHLAPLAFSNFFLLHKNNNEYYNKALSYIPADIGHVEWDQYFQNKDKDNFSALDFLMKQKSFRWAIVLVSILFALLFFIESKRRQRMVPVVQPLQNSSVDFVHTIGRLYFQQKDHKNLAYKMISHFLEQVRNKYNIPTSVLDHAFAVRLAHKGDFNVQEIKELLYEIKYVEDSGTLTEEELMSLSEKIEKFK